MHTFMGDSAAMFDLGSKMSHSCSPNMSFTTQDGRLVYRAIKSVTPGEQLTISYLPATYMHVSTQLRRGQLEFSKFFTCACERCVAPDSTRWMLCPQEGCESYVIRSENGSWACSKCGGVFTDDAVPLAAETQLQDAVLHVMQSGELLNIEHGLTMRELVGRVLGDRHWVYASISHLLFQSISATLSTEGDQWRPVFDVGCEAGEAVLSWSEANVLPWYSTHAAAIASELVALYSRDKSSAPSMLRGTSIAHRYLPILQVIYGSGHPRVAALADLLPK